MRITPCTLKQLPARTAHLTLKLLLIVTKFNTLAAEPDLNMLRIEMLEPKATNLSTLHDPPDLT
jgi:hypothetical protein